MTVQSAGNCCFILERPVCQAQPSWLRCSRACSHPMHRYSVAVSCLQAIASDKTKKYTLPHACGHKMLAMIILPWCANHVALFFLLGRASLLSGLQGLAFKAYGHSICACCSFRQPCCSSLGPWPGTP